MEQKRGLAKAQAEQPLIVIEDCSVGDILSPVIKSLDWRLLPGEAWVAVGPSGGGKEAFAAALAGLLPMRPNDGGQYYHGLEDSTAIVSFEAAAALLQKERYNDDSDFVEGGVSEGTTVRSFIAAALPAVDAPGYPGGKGLESHPAVQNCGVLECLDRGLKRLSTGECRRALLCRTVVSKPALIVAVEPYEGLDIATRSRLHGMLESLVSAAVKGEAGAPAIVIVDRLEHVPATVNRVVHFEGGTVRFAGSRDAFVARYAELTRRDSQLPFAPPSETGLARKATAEPEDSGNVPLIELKDVTVAWSGKVVLDRLSWTVYPDQHWLVRGPNGSGKTTLLELITGDNPQAYCNYVSVFGRRRGSGQTIWELKSQLGLVSYRLHLEYRYLADMALEDVILSGLYDSIGLYTTVGEGERELARSWLELAGFNGKGRQQFGRLSFGEQRALLVARAAIKLPKLLILDEPCHGLDETQRSFVLSLLASIARRGHSTMIHVTHDPNEVQSFETRVLELLPGQSPMWKITGGVE